MYIYLYERRSKVENRKWLFVLYFWILNLTFSRWIGVELNFEYFSSQIKYVQHLCCSISSQNSEVFGRICIKEYLIPTGFWLIRAAMILQIFQYHLSNNRRIARSLLSSLHVRSPHIYQKRNVHWIQTRRACWTHCAGAPIRRIAGLGPHIHLVQWQNGSTLGMRHYALWLKGNKHFP